MAFICKETRKITKIFKKRRKFHVAYDFRSQIKLTFTDHFDVN